MGDWNEGYCQERRKGGWTWSHKTSGLPGKQLEPSCLPVQQEGCWPDKRKQLQISDTMGLPVAFLRAVFLLGAKATVLPAWSYSREVSLGLRGATNHSESWKGVEGQSTRAQKLFHTLRGCMPVTLPRSGSQVAIDLQKLTWARPTVYRCHARKYIVSGFRSGDVTQLPGLSTGVFAEPARSPMPLPHMIVTASLHVQRDPWLLSLDKADG